MEMTATARSEHRRDLTDPGGPPADLLDLARRRAASEDATLVYVTRRRGGGQARLAVTNGPRQGAEFELRGQRISIGRGGDNSVVIPDLSVSRRHLVIESDGTRFLAVDQRSGNGTRVNGRKVERAVLREGDQIELGDTSFRFLGGASDDGSALRRRLPVYVAVGVSLLAVIAAGAIRKRPRASAAEVSAPAGETQQLARQRFEEGAALLEEGRWLEAREKLRVAGELDRGDPEIASQLESAELEAPRAEGLATARAALGRRDYAAARAAAAMVPDDSALGDQAREVERQIQAAMEEAVRGATVRVEANDLAAAAALIEPVLAAEPARPDALAVRQAIASTRTVVPGPTRRAAAAPARSKVADIVGTYLSGDVRAALRLAAAASADDAEAARLFDALRRFDAAAKDGRQAADFAAAVRAFERAGAADGEIARGAGSKPGGEVRAEVYLRAYLEKDAHPETARAGFRLVAGTLPPADEMAGKARRWLDRLDGKSAADD